jgi:hypothetical protein
MQALFTCLICVQFLVVMLHDLVDIPGWTHGSQVKAVVGPTKYWIGTLVNGVFPGVAVGYAIYWWGRTPSVRAADYWVIYLRDYGGVGGCDVVDSLLPGSE